MRTSFPLLHAAPLPYGITQSHVLLLVVLSGTTVIRCRRCAVTQPRQQQQHMRPALLELHGRQDVLLLIRRVLNWQNARFRNKEVDPAVSCSRLSAKPGIKHQGTDQALIIKKY